MYSHRFYLQLLLSMLIPACASAPAPRQAIEQDVQTTVRKFAEAVNQHRADEVYALMSNMWKIQFSAEEFGQYFEQNYDAFVEYADALQGNASALTVQATLENDICGHVAWQMAEDGHWKLAAVPTISGGPDEMKLVLLDVIRSRQFMDALDEYALIHPEWSGETLRHLKRKLMFEELTTEHVEFWAHEALLIVPDTAIIRMTCSSGGWRILQCYSTH